MDCADTALSMRSRDYTQEIGVSSARQRVSVTVAFIVLAIVAVAGIYFVRQVTGLPATHADTGAQPPVQVSSR